MRQVQFPDKSSQREQGSTNKKAASSEEMPLGPSLLHKKLGPHKTILINQVFRRRQGERKGDDWECGPENGPIKSWHLSCKLSARNVHHGLLV